MTIILRAVCLLVMCFTGFAAAQEVFKTVDENGKVIFSDKPQQEDSVEIDVKIKNVQPAINVRSRPKKSTNTTSNIDYQLQITSPTGGEKIGPAQRSVTVQASVSPRLRGAHRLQFYFDGNAIGAASKSTSATAALGLKQRGRRSVSASVVDASGKVLASSPSTTIYVIRP